MKTENISKGLNDAGDYQPVYSAYVDVQSISQQYGTLSNITTGSVNTQGFFDVSHEQSQINDLKLKLSTMSLELEALKALIYPFIEKQGDLDEVRKFINS